MTNIKNGTAVLAVGAVLTTTVYFASPEAGGYLALAAAIALWGVMRLVVGCSQYFERR